MTAAVVLLRCAVLTWLAFASPAAGVQDPQPSSGCVIHIAGNAGVSLELIGTLFTPSTTDTVSYTVDGGNRRSRTVSTDASGSFDLTIPTPPASVSTYYFVIADPRCTLRPTARAIPAPGISPDVISSPGIHITAPPTDAAPRTGTTSSESSDTAIWVLILGAGFSAALLLLIRRRPSGD